MMDIFESEREKLRNALLEVIGAFLQTNFRWVADDSLAVLKGEKGRGEVGWGDRTGVSDALSVVDSVLYTLYSTSHAKDRERRNVGKAVSQLGWAQFYLGEENAGAKEIATASAHIALARVILDHYEGFPSRPPETLDLIDVEKP